jgi:hypothetical protein
VSALTLTCSSLTDLVTEYLEHALEPAQRLGFETHLVYCPPCRTFLAQIHELVEQLHSLPPDPVEGADRAAVLAAYHAAR